MSPTADLLVKGLRATAASQFVRAHTWVWPTCETLHFMGLILLIGSIGVVDLRMLGLVKELPAKPLTRFVRWGVFGFLMNLLTGAIFFVGMPDQYVHNDAFYLKVVFIVLAGVNVMAFYATGVSRRVE